MPTTVRRLAAALGVLLATATTASAQGKIRIAIWEFQNNAGTNFTFAQQMAPAVRNQIDTEFSQNAQLAAKFSIIERDKLDLVLKEQGLAQTGAVDAKTAAKVGQLLGVKYIVTGGVDKFKIDNTGGGIAKFGVGGNLVQADATVSLRFVDTTTAERVISISADAEVKKGGGIFKGNSLSRDSERGITDETMQKAAKAVVAKLLAGDNLARVSAAAGGGALAGKIIKVEGDRAWINLGASSGVKVGDKFNVILVGEALVDPDTGKTLGADERQTGSGSVVEVQPEFAIMTFSGKANAKDTVRKP
jgi:curli biogenesis system outer membrane secretion channel CsgG